MAQISSNSLFHFTGSLDNLLSILDNGFFPRYSLDDWKEFMNVRFNFSFPMVCFCDIPLAQTQNHTSHYGRYAVGMSKAWAKKNKINPVLYTYRGSASSNHLSDAYKKLLDVKVISEDWVLFRDNLLDDIFNLAKYSKPYEGRYWDKRRGKFSSRKIVFYNEREWRYIPPMNEYAISRTPQAISDKVFFDKEAREHLNATANILKLSFDIEDIKHIIVAKEAEIPRIADHILLKKKKEVPLDQLILFITKIISLDQVITDI